MNIFRHVAAGLKELIRRNKIESELSEELNDYVQNAAEVKVQAGATPEEALRSARLEMGGMESVKHHVRAVGWEFALEVFVQDVRFGVRMLLKSPPVHSGGVDDNWYRDRCQHGHVQSGGCYRAPAFTLSRTSAPHCGRDAQARRFGTGTHQYSRLSGVA
jgi:hypothetical protein